MEIINGNIVDVAPALGTWFIVFDDGSETQHGFKTKQDAVDFLTNR